MSIQRSSAAPHDPFLSVVRRRHPDVDLVVLPPDPRPPDAPHEAPPDAPPDAVGEEAVRRASATLADLVARLGAAAGAPLEAAAPVRARYGRDASEVRLVCRVVRRHPDAAAARGRLGRELAAEGWEVRELAVGLPRLVAALDGVEVVASCPRSGGALVLTAASRPLAVGVARARELARAGEA